MPFLAGGSTQEVSGSAIDDVREEDYVEGSLAYLIMPKRKKNDEISLRSLSEEERLQFVGPGGSDEKEWQNLLRRKAARVIPPREASQI